MHPKQDLTRARTTAPESSRGGDLGDWLKARPNPLAIRMRLRSNGVGLTLEPPALAVALPNVSGRGMGGLVARSALHQAEQNARLGEVRSAGITDLRFGSLLDGDWKGQDRFAFRAHDRSPVPLPAGIQACAIGAVAGVTDDSKQARLIGDGLAPLDSALGRHPDPRHALAIPAENPWVALKTNPLDLQTSPAVDTRVRTWLSEGRPATRRVRTAA